MLELNNLSERENNSMISKSAPHYDKVKVSKKMLPKTPKKNLSEFMSN